MLVKIIPFLAFVLFFSVFAEPILAQTDTVSATVTVQNISVSVSDGSVAFGTLSTSATKDTTTNGVNDSQTATNDGNITVDFEIKAADTTDWALGSTAGSETYTMKSCTSNCDTSPTWTSVGISPSYVDLVTGVTASGNQTFDLQVGTPTSTSKYTEQTITVTVLASIS